jgi:hypothetical protein
MFVILISFLSVPSIFGQYYIEKGKPFIKNDMEKYFIKEKAISGISETDSSIKFIMIDSVSKKEFGYNFYFDKDGLCSKQEQISYCDSCLQLWIKSSLKMAQFNYRKVGENTWFAKYKKAIAMETKTIDGKYYLTWTKLYLSRKEYKTIIYSN